MPTKKSRTKASPSSSGPLKLPASALYRSCDPDSLGFETTDELPDLQTIIGQPRALHALQVGSELMGPGYNIFIMGLPASGRTTLSREFLERKAAAESVPDDWCYVNNFAAERQPIAIRFPAGGGSQFRKEIQDLVTHSLTDVPRAFEREEFTSERDIIINGVKKSQEDEFSRLQEQAAQFNFMVGRTSSGFILVPAEKGEPLKPEQIEALSPEQRQHMSEVEAELGNGVEKMLGRLREIETVAFERLHQLVTHTVIFVIGPMIGDLRKKYSLRPEVIQYLDALQNDIIENTTQSRLAPSSEPAQPPFPYDPQVRERRYRVNLLVDNSQLKGAPVITENYPSYNNLLGRIEHEVVMGAGQTDFTMIHDGALQRANGGYLILPARDVLVNPNAWEGLKRSLRDNEIRIIEPANQLGLLSTTTLEPQPIPLRVKIILIGTPTLYYMLRSYDEDFTKLFKMRAEFATIMDRKPDCEKEYGLFIKSVLMENDLPAFDNTAVARIIEFSSEMVEDQEKLSTRLGKIADLVREAAYWTAKSGGKVVTAKAVEKAIEEGIFRNNLVEERIQELINQNTLLIDVEGALAGQVNALSVLSLGDYSFGRPTRLTAVAFPGKAGITDIERQAKLGGTLHTKGVLILGGYLSWRYGQTQPLSLSASLTFEQSYDEVQGDSASAAELLALLSSIARVPVRQDRAITGSINQFGQIQAIGGVNQKIEGFFAACKAKGLTRQQGVIIPAANLRHLMLNLEVRQAVKAGRFHIWAVNTLEEVIQLLTDRQPGERQKDGNFPAGSFNQAVEARLAEFNQSMLNASKNSSRPAEPEPKGDKTEASEVVSKEQSHV